MENVLDHISAREMCLAVDGPLKVIHDATHADMKVSPELMWKFKMSRDRKSVDLMVVAHAHDGTRYDELIVRRAVDGGEWVPMKKLSAGSYKECTVDEWIGFFRRMVEFILS